jgi:hypothetical protein
MRGFLSHLATVLLDTPELDKHALELIKQSQAIAAPLLELRPMRADFATFVPDITSRQRANAECAGVEFRELHEYDPIAVMLEEWESVLEQLDDIDNSLGRLIRAVDDFLDAHAGEFA